MKLAINRAVFTKPIEKLGGVLSLPENKKTPDSILRLTPRNFPESCFRMHPPAIMLSTFVFLVVLVAMVSAQSRSPRKNAMKGRDLIERRSVLLLDGATFPKVMPHHNLSTVLMVSSRKDQGDYGVISMKEDFWAFADQSEFSGNSDYVRFAHMYIDLPFEEDSTDEATAQVISKLDPTFLSSRLHPRIYLFSPNSLTPKLYPQFSSINVVSLSRWLSQRAKYYMGIPGTIQAFYWLAREFMFDAKLEDDPEGFRQQVLAKTEETVEIIEQELKSEEYTELAKYYVKTMERVMERGEQYVADEISRLEDLVGGNDVKLSTEKRGNLQKRVNILHNFVVYADDVPNIDKEEL